MLRIDTAHFGPLDCSEDSVIEFPAGLPAFEDQTRFVLVEQPESAPLVFIQSLARPDLVFPALPVQVISPDYRLEMPAEDRALLGFAEQSPPPLPGRDLLCLAIVTAPAGAPPTANLLAPVVINLTTRRAVQVIQADAAYSHQFPLFQTAEPTPCS
jgi:flagellar assembly factor FliW